MSPGRVGFSCWLAAYLALGTGLPGYACVIILARYTERSGKINEVEELQYFLNELERNLRALDPRAEISLMDRKGPGPG